MRRATLPHSYASSSSSGTEDSQGGEVGPDPPWSVQQRSHTRHSRERFGTPMAVPPGGYLLARSRRSSPSRSSSPGRSQDVGGPAGTSEGREVVSESLRAENLRLRAQLEQIQEETARLVPTISQELNRLQGDCRRISADNAQLEADNARLQADNEYLRAQCTADTTDILVTELESQVKSLSLELASVRAQAQTIGPAPEPEESNEIRVKVPRPERVVEKRVEVPVEVIKEVPGPERVVEKRVEVPVEVIKTVEVIKEVPGPERVVEKRVEVPVEVIKTVEVIKEVPGPERIVEKRVEVPVEVIKTVEVTKEVPGPERIKEVSVEILGPERVVEKRVEVPVEVIKEVPGPERVVEKRVEVPVEVIKIVEVIKEVPGPERVVETKVEVPIEVIKQVPVEVIKTVEVIKEVPGPERINEIRVEVPSPTRVVEKRVEVPGPERVVEKRVEVPVEVIKEVPGPEREVIRTVEVIKEVPGPERVVEKIVEVPVEVIKEIPGPEREVFKTVEVIKEVPAPEHVVMKQLKELVKEGTVLAAGDELDVSDGQLDRQVATLKSQIKTLARDLAWAHDEPAGAVEKTVAAPGLERVVEKIVRVPGPERIIEKRVEVPGPERVVEKRVEVPLAFEPLPPGHKIYTIATYTGAAETAVPDTWVVDVKAVLGPLKILCEESKWKYQGVEQSLRSEKISASTEQLQTWQDAQIGDVGSPQTDATVWIELIGTGSDGADVSSGRHVLAQSTERGHDVRSHHGITARATAGQLFQAGRIDEFTLASVDLHTIHTCIIGHNNDGESNTSSRWKLDKVVVTCIQHEDGNSNATSVSGQAPTAKGDYATSSVTTTTNMQWHFTPPEKWIGCSTNTVARHGERFNAMLHERQLQILTSELRRVEAQLQEWQTKEVQVQQEAAALLEMSAEERREHADVQLSLWQVKEAEVSQDSNGDKVFSGSSSAERGRCFWSVSVGAPGEELSTGADKDALPTRPELLHSVEGSADCNKLYTVATYTGTADNLAPPEPWSAEIGLVVEPALIACDADDDLQYGAASRHVTRQQISVESPQLRTWENERLGGDGAVSPQTDATVWIELIGTLPNGKHITTGRRVLPPAGQALGGRAHLFQPGHVNEFMLLSQDLHQIHTCKIGHCNDGASAISSRWKLDKVVVTCIQHGIADQPTPVTRGSPGSVGMAGKGDHADVPLVTTNNHQEQLSLLKVEQERVQLELRKWEDRRDEVEVQRLKSRRERTTGECKQTLRIANDTDVDVDADASLPRARVHAPTTAEGIPPQQQHSHFRSAFE